MKITRSQATEILRYQLAHPEYKCPFEVMCQEVDQDNREEDDEDFVGLVPEDLDEEDKTLPEWYQTFEVWLNDISIPEDQEATVIANAFTHMGMYIFTSSRPTDPAGPCESLEKLFEQRKALVTEQIKYAEEDYTKDRSYERENNELPQVDCVEDLFAYGFLRGLRTAKDILDGKPQDK